MKKYTILLISFLFPAVIGTCATITLSAPGQVTASNICPGSIDVPIFTFRIESDGTPPSAILNTVNFTTTGNYIAADITGFKLWHDTLSNFSTATIIATAPPSGPNPQTFNSLTQAIALSSTHFFRITTSISSPISISHIIAIDTVNAIDLSFTGSPTINGSAPRSGNKTILASPTIAAAGSDSVHCNNDVFILSGDTPTVGSGLWSVVSGSATIISPGLPNSAVEDILVGNCAILRWTISNSICTSFDEVQLCNEPPLTIPDAGNDSSHCDNENFTLDGNLPSVGTGRWTLVNGTAVISDTTSPTSSVSIPVGSCATLRWSISNGTCGTLFNDVVLCNDSPVTVSVLGLDERLCDSGVFNLNGNNPSVGTGFWTVESGTAAIDTPTSPSPTIIGVPVGSCATLRWTITNGACNSHDDILLCNDAPVTVSDAGTNQAQCNDSDFILNGIIPTVGTGIWTLISGTATIGDTADPNSGVSSIPLDSCATLQWTITNGACNSSDDVILCNDAPTVSSNAGSDESKCNNSNFVLDANSPSSGTGLWTIQSGTAFIDDSTDSSSAVSGVPVGTCVTLRWIITDGSCVSTNDVVLCNDTLPTPPDADVDQNNCDNENFILSANGPLSGSGLWTIINGTAIIDSLTFAFSNVSGIPVGTCATLLWTISNGACLGSSDDVVLCNDDLPTPADAPDDERKCNDGTFFLEGNQPTLGSGLWSVVNGDATIDNASLPSTSIDSVPVGTCASLRWTITNGACSLSDDVQICNDLFPDPPANAGSDSVHCAQASFQLNGNIPPVGSGLWSILNGPGNITTPNLVNTVIDGVTAGSTTTVMWTITNGACVSVDTVAKTNGATTIASVSNNLSLCLQDSATISVSNISNGQAPYQVSWNQINDTCDGISENGGCSFLVSPLINTTFTATILDALGCSITRTQSITVNPIPPLPVFTSLPGNDTLTSIQLCRGSENNTFNLGSQLQNVANQWSSNSSQVIFSNPFDSITNISFFQSSGLAASIFAIVIDTSLSTLCRDTLEIAITLSNDNDTIVEKTIVQEQPGNLLVYLDNNVDSYQWGCDKIAHGITQADDSIASTSKFPDQVYQALVVPDSLIVNGQIDTSNYWFWVEVHVGSCFTKVYFTGPYCFRCKLSGPEQLSAEVSVDIMPNPNTGKFTLRISGDVFGNLKASVHNYLGQRVHQEVLHKKYPDQDYSVALEQPEPGIYFIELEDYQQRRIMTKFIIY